MTEQIFFLGAGASREAGIPTQKELWEKIQDKYYHSGDQTIKEILDFAAYLNFAEPKDKVQINTAELLTLMDLTLEQNSAMGRYGEKDLRQIREALVAVICDILEGAVKKERYGVLADFCHQLTHKDSIISLNYDTVMDHVILDCQGAVDYGFPFELMDGGGCFSPKQDWKPILLKPHGSLNWLYCPRCNHLYLLVSSMEKDTALGMKCRRDQHPLSRVIVTPSYHKRFLVPQLHDVWRRCFEAINRAQVIYFIGYSFPPGDVHIIHLIKRAVLAGGQCPEIYVISPDSDGAVFKSCENIFSSFHYYQASFHDYFYGRM
ncbi:SIR2 family protein [Dehalobacterium formicoaceticum]|uniref:SIR2 family protein n=1 Tax=Dehalobacterium formicoaceticum TaxID=51515 RepID=UPI0031F61360